MSGVTVRPQAEVLGPPRLRQHSDLVSAFFLSKSPRTRSSYEDDLSRFAAYSGAPNIGDAIGRLLDAGHGPANELALGFRDHMVAKGNAPATVNRRLAAVRAVVQLARMLGYVSWALDVPGVRTEVYRDTRGPGLEGVRAMLRILEGARSPKAIRDRAILRLLFDLGLRREEICSLDTEHLDAESGLLWVHGKGKAARLPMSVPAPTMEALMVWLAIHPLGAGALFTNFDRAGKGGRLTGHSLYRIVREIGRKAGLAAPVRPHGLRHAAITVALDATGGDVRAVQRFSRHAKIETVTRYDDNRRDLGGQVAKLISQAV